MHPKGGEEVVDWEGKEEGDPPPPALKHGPPGGGPSAPDVTAAGAGISAARRRRGSEPLPDLHEAAVRLSNMLDLEIELLEERREALRIGSGRQSLLPDDLLAEVRLQALTAVTGSMERAELLRRGELYANEHSQCLALDARIETGQLVIPLCLKETDGRRGVFADELEGRAIIAALCRSGKKAAIAAERLRRELDVKDLLEPQSLSKRFEEEGLEAVAFNSLVRFSPHSEMEAWESGERRCLVDLEALGCVEKWMRREMEAEAFQESAAIRVARAEGADAVGARAVRRLAEQERLKRKKVWKAERRGRCEISASMLTDAEDERRRLREWSAQAIQAIWRGVFARKRYQERRAILEEWLSGAVNAEDEEAERQQQIRLEAVLRQARIDAMRELVFFEGHGAGPSPDLETLRLLTLRARKIERKQRRELVELEAEARRVNVLRHADFAYTRHWGDAHAKLRSGEEDERTDIALAESNLRTEIEGGLHESAWTRMLRREAERG
eukprot:Hpha_TRINITY_DN31643_c0_g1::TRINITY_DN31643_c0_g1_i1::g.29148::m.29148